MVSELSIDIIVKLTQEICVLLSFFDRGLTTDALPSLLFDDYDMLSDKPSQPSPLDVAPADLPRHSGK